MVIAPDSIKSLYFSHMEEHLLVGISGGSGSGKTSFLKKLRSSFTEQELCMISLDDYYRPIEEQQRDERGWVNFDLPSCIDKKALRKDLEALQSGETVVRKEYTFNNELATPATHTYYPAPIILIEGLFIFHFKKINALFHLRVFLEAKENLKVIRRIKRDQIERNYPIDEVLYQYEHHVLPAYEKYVEPYKSICDLIINNHTTLEPGTEVLSGYFSHYLSQRNISSH